MGFVFLSRGAEEECDVEASAAVPGCRIALLEVKYRVRNAYLVLHNFALLREGFR